MPPPSAKLPIAGSHTCRKDSSPDAEPSPRPSPAFLYQEAASTLLSPDTRTLNPFVTQEQAYLAISAPLPFLQSLLLVWPQVVAMIAETSLSFAASYVLFMRQEIRSRS